MIGIRKSKSWKRRIKILRENCIEGTSIFVYSENSKFKHPPKIWLKSSNEIFHFKGFSLNSFLKNNSSLPIKGISIKKVQNQLYSNSLYPSLLLEKSGSNCSILFDSGIEIIPEYGFVPLSCLPIHFVPENTIFSFFFNYSFKDNGNSNSPNTKQSIFTYS